MVISQIDTRERNIDGNIKRVRGRSALLFFLVQFALQQILNQRFDALR